MLLGFIYSIYRFFDYSNGSYRLLKNLGKVYTGKVIFVESKDYETLIQYEVTIEKRNRQKEKAILNYTTSNKRDISPNDFCVVLYWDNDLNCLL